eukprot:4261406-Amphidinium_carterae.1
MDRQRRSDFRIGEDCYRTGGRGDHHSGDRDLATNERFDPIGYRWECLPPMPTARAQCAVAAAQGQSECKATIRGVHIVRRLLTGASNPHSHCKAGRDPLMGSLVLNLNPRLSRFMLQGKLQVFGGNQMMDKTLAAAESFDPSEQRWEQLPWMTRPRDACVRLHFASCLALPARDWAPFALVVSSCELNSLDVESDGTATLFLA